MYANYNMSGSVLANTYPGKYPNRPRPYAAKGGVMALTDKERAARKFANFGSSMNLGSIGGIGGANVTQSSSNAFFSPQLSTDFLQLPQSLREQRELHRHYYKTDPLVAQAIDLHTELPMSKVILAKPKPSVAPPGFRSPEHYGDFILDRFKRMCSRIKLFQRLITASRQYWLDGNVYLFAEDSTVEVPYGVGHERVRQKTSVLNDEGVGEEVEEEVEVERPDRESRELSYYQKHYKGWERLTILPIDQIKLTTYPFSNDKVKIELIPSDRERELVERAKYDENAEEMLQHWPAEVRRCVEEGRTIPLGTDPDEGSFCYHLAARRNAGEELGESLLSRCMRTLTYREKLRQAQTLIADRAMTPRRLVWAEGLDDAQTDDLREQVDLALVDPDYSVVTNYEVRWEEMSARDRLLDLSSEYDITDKQLYAGLGVTESLLNGESTFAGDRVKLEVINTRYLLFREIIQEYVEEYLFKPVARRMGFVELDEWGQEVVLYPSLRFSRLALRDSQDTYDALFNLYQKGSLPIDLILDLFNIDPADAREKIERDAFTVNDSTFNEVFRSLYSEIGRELVNRSNAMEKVIEYLNLSKKEASGDSGGGRWG